MWGFWGLCRSAFFEFRALYAYARSKQNVNDEGSTRSRSAVEDGDFTPMIMSSSGGMGPETVIALKYLARLIALKRDEDCSATCLRDDEDGFDLLAWLS